MKIRYISSFIVLLFILVACSGNDPTGETVAPFSFEDQHEQSFGTGDLEGKVWIASFVFTNCETVCPPMMYEMASLQKEFEKEGIEAEFVTFTVDPEVDSSRSLKQYMDQFTDDDANWHMLTGYSQETIEAFAREQFQTIVQKPDNTNQVIHGTNFYLVDDQGYIVHEFNYIDETYMEEMIDAINNI